MALTAARRAGSRPLAFLPHFSQQSWVALEDKRDSTEAICVPSRAQRTCWRSPHVSLPSPRKTPHPPPAARSTYSTAARRGQLWRRAATSCACWGDRPQVCRLRGGAGERAAGTRGPGASGPPLPVRARRSSTRRQSSSSLLCHTHPPVCAGAAAVQGVRWQAAVPAPFLGAEQRGDEEPREDPFPAPPRSDNTPELCSGGSHGCLLEPGQEGNPHPRHPEEGHEGHCQGNSASPGLQSPRHRK